MSDPCATFIHLNMKKNIEEIIISMIIQKKTDVNQLMERFCQDALTELKTYDRKLRNRLIKGEETGNTGKFYSDYPKGLSIYSITEPIIKWLIYTNLCDRYCMWPELQTSNGKFLDLALFLDPDSGYPEIAIEMKWAGFRKDGRIDENSRKGMVDDAIKLHGLDFSNKYLMQFSIMSENDYKHIDTHTTAEYFHFFDKRQFRNSVLNHDPIFIDSFPTWDDVCNPKRFAIIVWEINRK